MADDDSLYADIFGEDARPAAPTNTPAPTQQVPSIPPPNFVQQPPAPLVQQQHANNESSTTIGDEQQQQQDENDDDAMPDDEEEEINIVYKPAAGMNQDGATTTTVAAPATPTTLPTNMTTTNSDNMPAHVQTLHFAETSEPLTHISIGARVINNNVAQNAVVSNAKSKELFQGASYVPLFSDHPNGPKMNIAEYDVDLDALDEKPWRIPGADMSDYFNYGFNEETWKMYCRKQKQIRGDVQYHNSLKPPAPPKEIKREGSPDSRRRYSPKVEDKSRAKDTKSSTPTTTSTTTSSNKDSGSKREKSPSRKRSRERESSSKHVSRHSSSRRDEREYRRHPDERDPKRSRR